MTLARLALVGALVPSLAHAGPGARTCRWIVAEAAERPSQDDVLEAIADDRDHAYTAETVDCLRARGVRTPILQAAARRWLRDLATAGPGPFPLRADDPALPPAFVASVLLSKRVELVTGWTERLLLHPTHVDPELPPWLPPGHLLDGLRLRERPGTQVPALDLADEVAANVDPYDPIPTGRLGDPSLMPRLAQAPLGWTTDRHARVLWLDLEAVEDGVAVTWAVNRLDQGAPYLPVAPPERFELRTDLLPEAALSTPTATARRRGWPAGRVATAVGGLAVLVAGATTAAVTTSQYDDRLDVGGVRDPRNQRLVVANTAGWGLAITGGAAAILGFAIPDGVWRR